VNTEMNRWGSIKSREFVQYLSICEVPKQSSALRNWFDFYKNVAAYNFMLTSL
jgi:hypothetical protein